MSEALKQYTKVKKEISSLISKKDRLDGKKEQILSDLKETFGLTNIEDALEQLDTMGTEHSNMESEIEAIVKELEKIVEEASDDSI